MATTSSTVMQSFVMADRDGGIAVHQHVGVLGEEEWRRARHAHLADVLEIQPDAPDAADRIGFARQYGKRRPAEPNHAGSGVWRSWSRRGLRKDRPVRLRGCADRRQTGMIGVAVLQAEERGVAAAAQQVVMPAALDDLAASTSTGSRRHTIGMVPMRSRSRSRAVRRDVRWLPAPVSNRAPPWLRRAGMIGAFLSSARHRDDRWRCPPESAGRCRDRRVVAAGKSP